MAKAIVLNNILPKARKVYGQTTQFQLNNGENHNAAIVRNDTIRIYGVYCGKPYDIAFKLGDTAEYDSYNLKYLGEIVAITDKGVTIKPKYGDRTKRLDLYTFCWRNRDFDLARISAENAETSHCI